jgi:hypothetical protein
MKVLLYGMQSSGASVLAFALAQKPESLGFIDVWNMFAAPVLETNRDCVAKVVVTTAYNLETHRKRFQPDVTLLVLRHPVDNYYSLFGKSYENESGLIDEKFLLLEETLRGGTGFDHIVHYEDFVFCPREIIGLFNRIGWGVGFEALQFNRTPKEIETANAAAYPDLQARLKYGSGNVNPQGILRDRIRFSSPWGKTEHLPRLCPFLLEHYAVMREERGDAWRVPSPALLSCNLDALIRGRHVSGAIQPLSVRASYTVRLTNGTPQCRVSDTQLVLCPTSDGQETTFSVSGLPALPFNRICGAAFTEHPLAEGAVVRIRVKTSEGDCLAEKAFTLSHSDMRQFEVDFKPQVSPITLSLSVRVADTASSTDNAGLCFRDLRLEEAVV